MKKFAFVILTLLLVPFAVQGKIDGIVEFRIGDDSTNAYEMSVVNGNGMMINIYRYNAYKHADRMPRPLHKDTAKKVWCYRAVDETSSMWLLMNEATGSTFYAMKDFWLQFRSYAVWWTGKDGITTQSKIQQAANKKSPVVPADSLLCKTFKVTEVSGDWMKISYSPSGCVSQEEKHVGWVMWRRKGTWMVSFAQ